MNHSLIFRILIYVAIIFSLVNGWWFIALPLLLIGAWKYSFNIEIIVAGVMYDALFGMVRSMGIWGYVGTISAILLLIVFALLKKIVR